jgi:hypothetical protein
MVHIDEITEHSRLVRKYLADHRDEWRRKKGAARWVERIRLELRAWKYATAETAKRRHDPDKPYIIG